jgi:hypothetical protein
MTERAKGKDPAIVVLSAPGREDVADLYLQIHRLLWKDCPWRVRIESGSTSSGWTKRLLSILEKVEEDILLLNLDDYVLCRSPETETIVHAARFLSETPEFASIYLDRCGYAPERPAVGIVLPGFALYDKGEPLYKRTQLLPVLARVSAWRELARGALAGLSVAKDEAWVGAYNFELFSARPSLAFEVAAPMAGPRNGPLAVVDLTQQDGWTEHGIGFLRRLGLDVPASSSRKTFSGESPYMQRWRAAR